MNHDPTETRMRELSWRRELTGAEQAELRAWLAAHPEAVAQWQEETALNSLLEQLPNAPVSNNFTARVMQDIEREAMAAERQHVQKPHWWQRVLLPRLAFGAVLLAGLFMYRHNVTIKTERLTAPLVAFGDTKELLSVDVLQDFNSIAQLGPRVQPDMELLSLMQ